MNGHCTASTHAVRSAMSVYRKTWLWCALLSACSSGSEPREATVGTQPDSLAPPNSVLPSGEAGAPVDPELAFEILCVEAWMIDSTGASVTANLIDNESVNLFYTLGDSLWVRVTVGWRPSEMRQALVSLVAREDDLEKFSGS